MNKDRLHRNWLEAVAWGHEPSYELLYKAVIGPVTKYIAKQLSSREAAEDAAADTMFEVWRKAHSYEGRSTVLTWILGIAKYKVLKAYEKQSHSLPPQTVSEPDFNRGQYHPDDARMLITGDWWSYLMRDLSEAQRETLLMYNDGYTIKDIAAVQDSPESTVKTRRFYARAKLQTQLDEEVA